MLEQTARLTDLIPRRIEDRLLAEASTVEPAEQRDGSARCRALVTDYLEQAKRLQELPMATSLLDGLLELS